VINTVVAVRSVVGELGGRYGDLSAPRDEILATKVVMIGELATFVVVIAAINVANKGHPRRRAQFRGIRRLPP
jgi:hypothetical protein